MSPVWKVRSHFFCEWRSNLLASKSASCGSTWKASKLLGSVHLRIGSHKVSTSNSAFNTGCVLNICGWHVLHFFRLLASSAFIRIKECLTASHDVFSSAWLLISAASWAASTHPLLRRNGQAPNLSRVTLKSPTIAAGPWKELALWAACSNRRFIRVLGSAYLKAAVGPYRLAKYRNRWGRNWICVSQNLLEWRTSSGSSVSEGLYWIVLQSWSKFCRGKLRPSRRTSSGSANHSAKPGRLHFSGWITLWESNINGHLTSFNWEIYLLIWIFRCHVFDSREVIIQHSSTVNLSTCTCCSPFTTGVAMSFTKTVRDWAASPCDVASQELAPDLPRMGITKLNYLFHELITLKAKGFEMSMGQNQSTSKIDVKLCKAS